MNYCYMETAVGRLMLAADSAGLCNISFSTSRHRRAPDPAWIEGESPVLAQTKVQLTEYFAGTRREFSVLHKATGTAFQQQVWSELCNIAYGETATYRDIAERIGRPMAMRAVGAANGSNPIPIIIPCHRIIGSNGALIGFGGGIEIKAALLAHERSHLDFRLT